MMNNGQVLSYVIRSSHKWLSNGCTRCLAVRCRLLQSQTSNFASTNIGTGTCVTRTSPRAFSTSSRVEMKLWKKIMYDFGFISGLTYSKSILKKAGLNMFICCAELVNHKQFFKDFDMPDTFNSWFVVTSLHVWLCMVRLSDLDKDGRQVRNGVVKALWEDTEIRSNRLGTVAASTRKEGIQHLGDQFLASIYDYDTGLLGSDKDLAASVWRNFFQMRPDVESQLIELMVAYIRKQVAHLDSQDSSQLLQKGFVTFLPIHGDQLDLSVNALRNILAMDKKRI